MIDSIVWLFQLRNPSKMGVLRYLKLLFLSQDLCLESSSINSDNFCWGIQGIRSFHWPMLGIFLLLRWIFCCCLVWMEFDRSHTHTSWRLKPICPPVCHSFLPSIILEKCREESRRKCLFGLQECRLPNQNRLFLANQKPKVYFQASDLDESHHWDEENIYLHRSLSW